MRILKARVARQRGAGSNLGEVEAFIAAGVAGVGALLALVAALAARRAEPRKMGVLAAAFAAAALGGVYMLAGELAGGPLQANAPTVFAAATLACLALMYGALFAPRSRRA